VSPPSRAARFHALAPALIGIILASGCQPDVPPRVDITSAPGQTQPPPPFLAIQGQEFLLEGRPFVMRGFNYMPRNHAWSSMEVWNWIEVEAELAAAQELGANVVRIFIDYGYSTANPDYALDPVSNFSPTTTYIEAIDEVLRIADRHGLKVVLTLFDFMPGFLFVDHAPARCGRGIPR